MLAFLEIGEAAMATEERENNPYAAPKEGGTKRKRVKKKVNVDLVDDETTIDQIVRSFQKTESWISFFGALSYIGAVILAIGGIVMLAITSDTRLGRASAFVGPFALLLYGALAATYAVVGARLFRYRDAIKNVVRNDGQLEHIADAVERQAQFWTFVGKLSVAAMVLYGIILIIGLIAGASR
jgi:hypothetical protein